MQNAFEIYRDVIPDYRDFEAHLYRLLPVHFRVNTLKSDPETVSAMMMEKGIQLDYSIPFEKTLAVVCSGKSVGTLPEYYLGYIHPQALTSCLTSLALSPAPDSSVLDMCAAPGGKTSHMTQLMGNTGLIVANELFPDRHVAMGNTLSRLGVLNTIVCAYQAQEFPLKMKYDFILADVPCSGEGRFRWDPKRPEQGHRIYPKHLQKLGQTQPRILLRGFDLLKTGGELLYATCTYNPDENEAVVNRLLREREQADLLPMDIPLRGEPGLLKWKGETYDKRLRHSERFYPHRVDSVGFFMARIVRRD